MVAIIQWFAVSLDNTKGVRRTIVWWALFLFAVALGACSPDRSPLTDRACVDDSDCLAGQQCIQGFCPDEAVRDAGARDTGNEDVAAPDIIDDPPVPGEEDASHDVVEDTDIADVPEDTGMDVGGDPTADTPSPDARPDVQLDDTTPCDRSDHLNVEENCGCNGPCGFGEECEDGECALPDGYALVMPGTFSMGSPVGENERDAIDEDQHEVRITRPFLIRKREVTQSLWTAKMNTRPSYFEACNDCPVESVSWWDAIAFANALSRHHNLDECYALSGCSGTPGSGCDEGDSLCTGDYQCESIEFSGLDCEGYRLPTEAEWEYAARAGTQTALHNGDLRVESCDDVVENLGRIGWYCANSDNRIHPVAELDDNAWGVFDMSGNAAEWVWDYYGQFYYFESPEEDPLGPDMPSGNRMLRGGSWFLDPVLARSASRRMHIFGSPVNRGYVMGFRVVRTVAP